MSTERHIFFDLDHTLWDFERNAQEAITELLGEYRHHIGEDVDPGHFYGIYSAINRELWGAYERREIEMEAVRKGRWERAFAEVRVSEGSWMKEFGQQYISLCPTKPHLMDGATELIQALHGQYGLGIITNGISSNQFTKLKRSGLLPYFSDVVTVDMAGVPKPEPGIFHFAMQRAGREAHACMYIGDTYLPDVVGPLEVGMSVIFFNPHQIPNPGSVVEARHLSEIPLLLESAWRSPL